MRMKEYLEIAGATANFAGGIVLLIDAVRVRLSIREKSGGNIFQDGLNKAKVADAPRDAAGKPLDTEEARESWLSAGLLKRSWIGFALLVAGFGCEIASHFFS
jgi:hypothetical protein